MEHDNTVVSRALQGRMPFTLGTWGQAQLVEAQSVSEVAWCITRRVDAAELCSDLNHSDGLRPFCAQPFGPNHFSLGLSRCDTEESPSTGVVDGEARPLTIYEKIFNDHVIDRTEDGTCLIYIDRHLVHEVTSPQAFESMAIAGRRVRRPDCTLATVDHNIPTSSRKGFKDISTFIEEADSRNQCETLEANVKDFGLTYF
eukprot:5321618-Amphidinium_carterae.1